MKGFGDLYRSKKKINKKDKLLKEQIINKAFQFHQKGNISGAVKYYQIFINRGFSDERVFSNYGNILRGLGKLEEAEIYHRKAIEINPDFAIAHYNMGNVLKDLGKLQDAELSYRKAIELNPKFAHAYSNLGILMKDLGKLQDAELSYRKAIEINPDFAMAHCNLGNVLKDLGKLQDAELSYRKAIELNPKFANAYSNLGIILSDLGSFKEAEFSVRKAIELNPKDAILYTKLGGILKVLRKFKEAEFSVRKAIQINPDYAEAYLNLGIILSDLGKLKKAEESILHAIKINPNFGKAYFFLSKMGVSNRHKNLEKYLFSRYIVNNQKNINLINIYFARANILEKKLKYKESSNMFMKANSLNRKIYGSNYIQVKNEMQYFYRIWQNIKSKQVRKKNQLTSIFIVGLPRSGKTITESILSCNNSLLQCGEDNALSKAVVQYLNPKGIPYNQDLYQLFVENISKEISNKSYICATTPDNYKFTGIIASQIVKSKVIYCFRNPLDNIKELFCSNLENKFTFKTSIVESAKILLSINELMENYKKVYNSKIYFLNYDKLVLNPENEIKLLLSWLGFEYKNEYLYPKLDPTTTFNSDKTNGLINTKYLNVWKDYEKLLQPAIEIITSNNKYLHLIS
tara:strand:- start:326 stop:2218 length:1893 start_codon:yes stop_codon:yes gene_type:complete